MQAAMSAQMCRLESPSLTVESEPDNVLNTASPGRRHSWILPSEMMRTPDRPTTGGLQTPTGAPVQLGPCPVTQQYSRRSDLSIPPAQWGNQDGRDEGEEECELFRDPQEIHSELYSNKIKEWSTRTSYRLLQLQFLLVRTVQARQVHGV